MTADDFTTLVQRLTAKIAGSPLDDALMARLNGAMGPGSADFDDLAAACRTGIDEGWLCEREHGGVRYGRIIKPGPATHGFSVDVVLMDDVVGPHHAHPKGEIDLIVPTRGDAEFDGHGRGWLVYGPGSAHKPTVAGGEAIVLYLLPGGEIDFTRA